MDSSDIGSQEESDAEREWKESLQQLELLLTMVVIPYIGKYFGRKCAYWGELLRHLHMEHWLTAFSYRLGEVYGMVVSGRGPLHERNDFQGYGCSSCGGYIVNDIMSNPQGRIAGDDLVAVKVARHMCKALEEFSFCQHRARMYV